MTSTTLSLAVTAQDKTANVKFQTYTHVEKLWDSSLNTTFQKVSNFVVQIFKEAFKYIANACIHAANVIYSYFDTHTVIAADSKNDETLEVVAQETSAAPAVISEVAPSIESTVIAEPPAEAEIAGFEMAEPVTEAEVAGTELAEPVVVATAEEMAQTTLDPIVEEIDINEGIPVDQPRATWTRTLGKTCSLAAFIGASAVGIHYGAKYFGCNNVWHLCKSVAAPTTPTTPTAPLHA